ncbi:type 1 glutamine amidotransferase [Janibacter sp. G56]|uniref:type 1 glutamine amidotransferase n=1 Tax=Janibacter sp. G56 TaxID=3418717 RepID=UPI003CFCB363
MSPLPRPRVTVVQHEEHVPLERLQSWLTDDAGLDLDVRLVSRETVPDLADIGDGLLVLGGTMNARDDDRAPWLPAVRALLADAVEAGVPTFGVCLGHQLLAEALGGHVSVADPKGPEHGPVRVTWSDEAANDPVLGPAAATGDVVPQMHDDVVDIPPPGAVVLASSQRHAVQAMRVGSALSVQFHPEAGPELMDAWAQNHGAPAGEMAALMQPHDDRIAVLGRALAVAWGDVVRARAAGTA